MKKKILIISMAMAMILTSACSSKSDSKDKKVKDKDETTTEATEASEDEYTEATPAEKETTEATPAEKETTEATTEESTEETTSEATAETSKATAETSEATAETSEETTTEAPTETSERDENGYVFDLSGMTAEQIADLCDSLTTRKIPQVGDTVEDVRKTYYDVEPWNYTQEFCGRYSKSDKDNVNCIYVSGVYGDGSEENGGPIVNKVTNFGTGLVIDICDKAKADEFIVIMKERHPAIEQKNDGSWKGEDFVVGITPIDYFDSSKGTHFQIAYGEKSTWYESVAGFFGFGMEISD
ncbi:MAG: hypothetical protein IKG93_08065 [Clostridiales bacterium]|nr:hypothetical protein [Clostridiales bacterium]